MRRFCGFVHHERVDRRTKSLYRCLLLQMYRLKYRYDKNSINIFEFVVDFIKRQSFKFILKGYKIYYIQSRSRVDFTKD